MKNFNVENACHAIATAAAQCAFRDFNVHATTDRVTPCCEAARIYAEAYKHAMQEFFEMDYPNQ